MSDRSSKKHGSRSSGKRRRKKKESIKFQGMPQKTLAKDGLSLFAVFLGFLLACTILLLIAGGLTNRRKVNPDAIKVADQKRLEPDEFELLLESNDLEQLTKALKKLSVLAAREPKQRQVVVHRQRSQLASRMLKIDLDSEQKTLAVAAKLDSLAKMENLNRKLKLREPSVAPALRAFAGKYADYGEPEIQFLARVILIQLETVEPAPDIGLLSNSMVSLARDFPHDSRLAKHLRDAVEYQLNDSSRRQMGGALARAISSAEFEGSQLNRLKNDMRDWSQLVELRYHEAWAARELSPEQLLEVALELINQREAGTILLDHIQKIAFWFEQGNQIQSALQLYQTLATQSERYKYTKVALQARDLGRQGVTRCQSFQQPLDFAGKLTDGSELENSMFEGQVGLIVFWSTSDDESIRALDKIKRQSRAWAGQAVRPLAVCIDRPEDSSFRRDVFADAEELLGDWMIAVRGEDGSLPLLEQCPSDRVPRIVLTDFNRIVMRVNVPVVEVQTQVGSTLIYSRQ
jgi:hypothetical protein